MTPAKFLSLTPEQAWKRLWDHMKRPPTYWHPKPFDWHPKSKAQLAAIRRMRRGRTFTVLELNLRVKNGGGAGGVLNEALRYGVVDYTGVTRIGGKAYRLYRRIK